MTYVITPGMFDDPGVLSSLARRKLRPDAVPSVPPVLHPPIDPLSVIGEDTHENGLRSPGSLDAGSLGATMLVAPPASATAVPSQFVPPSSLPKPPGSTEDGIDPVSASAAALTNHSDVVTYHTDQFRKNNQKPVRKDNGVHDSMYTYPDAPTILQPSPAPEPDLANQAKKTAIGAAISTILTRIRGGSPGASAAAVNSFIQGSQAGNDQVARQDAANWQNESNAVLAKNNANIETYNTGVGAKNFEYQQDTAEQNANDRDYDRRMAEYVRGEQNAGVLDERETQAQRLAAAKKEQAQQAINARKDAATQTAQQRFLSGIPNEIGRISRIQSLPAQAAQVRLLKTQAKAIGLDDIGIDTPGEKAADGSVAPMIPMTATDVAAGQRGDYYDKRASYIPLEEADRHANITNEMSVRNSRVDQAQRSLESIVQYRKDMVGQGSQRIGIAQQNAQLAQRRERFQEAVGSVRSVDQGLSIYRQLVDEDKAAFRLTLPKTRSNPVTGALERVPPDANTVEQVRQYRAGILNLKDQLLRAHGWTPDPNEDDSFQVQPVQPNGIQPPQAGLMFMNPSAPGASDPRFANPAPAPGMRQYPAGAAAAEAGGFHAPVPMTRAQMNMLATDPRFQNPAHLQGGVTATGTPNEQWEKAHHITTQPRKSNGQVAGPPANYIPKTVQRRKSAFVNMGK